MAAASLMKAYDRRTRRTATENPADLQAAMANSRSLTSLLDRELRRPHKARPLTPMPLSNQITVKETDLKKYGSDLAMLRQCSVPHLKAEGPKEAAPPTFKDEFHTKCVNMPADRRDPWRNVANPEDKRTLKATHHGTVNDQVWVHKDTAVEGDAPRGGMSNLGFYGQASLQDVASLPARLEGVAKRNDSKTRLSRFGEDQNAMERRGQRHATVHLPLKPGSSSEVQSRIRPREDEFSSPSASKGSPLVQEATRLQKTGLRQLEDASTPCRYVWLVSGTASGEVQLYTREAAERLEVSRRTGRKTVPLSGLESAEADFEGCIVNLEEDGMRGVERNFNGTERQLLRAEVAWDATEVRAYVAKQGASWRLSDAAAEGADERLVKIGPSDMFRPASKASAREAAAPAGDGKLYYLNPGAYVASC